MDLVIVEINCFRLIVTAPDSIIWLKQRRCALVREAQCCWWSSCTLLDGKAVGDVANDHVSVLVTALGSPRVLGTKKGEMIYLRDANPCKEGHAQARRY